MDLLVLKSVDENYQNSRIFDYIQYSEQNSEYFVEFLYFWVVRIAELSNQKHCDSGYSEYYAKDARRPLKYLSLVRLT